VLELAPADGYPGTMPATAGHAVALVDHDLCDQCGLCVPLCRPGAIRLGRHGLTVDPSACDGCGKCVAPCPVGALGMSRA